MAFSGTRLKIAIGQKGITQTVLAYRLGVDRSQITNWIKEKYEPRDEFKQKIANVLNVSEAWLSGFDVPMHDHEETAAERHDRWLKEFEKLSDNGKQLLLDSIKKLEALSSEQKEMFLAMFAGAVASQADQPK